MRRNGSRRWTVPSGLTFRDWLRGAGEHRPTSEDLAYHVSTLFPPVRPRGHLELRMIDAQPADGWIVPAGLVAALLADPVAADQAMAAAEPVWPGRAGSGNGAGGRAADSPWLERGPAGPADPVLARAGLACFEAADAALSRSGRPARGAGRGGRLRGQVRIAGPLPRRRHAGRDAGGIQMTAQAEDLRDRIAGLLVRARDRTSALTECVAEDDLIRQHSPLMSPLVWDLAHVANQEELWLLRGVGGRDPMRPEIDPLYDAFEHPRAERPSLPLLAPAEARALCQRGARAGPRPARAHQLHRAGRWWPAGSCSA